MAEHSDREMVPIVRSRPDATFDEPPLLRRLGTLAELTRGDAGGNEDGNIGWSGDLGSV